MGAHTKVNSLANRHYVCDECDIVFTIHGVLKWKPGCPNCYDSGYVRKYSARRNGGDKYRKQRWSKDELVILQEVVDGKELPYRAAMRVGRSVNAVSKKVGRMRKERERH